MSKKDSTHKIQKSIRRILDDPFCVLCNSFPVGHKTQQRIEIWRRLRCVQRVFIDGRRRSNLWIGVRKWIKRISGGERGILWKKQDHGIAKRLKATSNLQNESGIHRKIHIYHSKGTPVQCFMQLNRSCNLKHFHSFLRICTCLFPVAWWVGWFHHSLQFFISKMEITLFLSSGEPY